MTYLLDTHYLIWAIADSKKISKKLQSVLINPDNRIIVSTISFWEISLKSSLGKLTIAGFSPDELPPACEQVGFEILPLTASDSSSFYLLNAVYHKDPFDRMLIWQAIRNRFTLISADEQINKYGSEGLKIYSQ
jgi:PIN domain nuclease of toxin-antitoxin system